MIEEIFGTVSKYMDERIRLSKGILFVLAAGSFILGVLTGVCAAKLSGRKKAAAVSSGVQFDPDDYLSDLDYDEQ